MKSYKTDNLNFVFETRLPSEKSKCYIYCPYTWKDTVTLQDFKRKHMVASIAENGRVIFSSNPSIVVEKLTIEDFEDIQRASELVKKFNGR